MEPSKPGQGSAPEPLVVRLPHASIDDFIQRYAAGLTAGGIYLRSDAPKPVGTLVQLEVLLRSGERVLFGLGMVSFRTAGESAGLAGMGIKFLGLDQPSTALVARACAGRAGADAPLPPLPAASAAVEGEGAPPPATIFAFHASNPSPSAPPTVAQPRNASAVIESPLDRVKPLRGRPQGPIIGIDLGTTYSCVACVKGGKPYVIPSREGHNTLPSVIALSSRNRMLVGHPAKGQMLTNPRQTVYGAKRLIGRPFNSDVVQQVRERFQYDIVEGGKGEASVKLGGRVWSLQQISAMVLLETREVAEQHLGTEVRRAVITVPAYYNDAQRQAVREAGALAGLHVERIINEPTAAALAFGSGRQLQKTVLIYDLGGGTFDASLLQLSGNVYEVVSTGGDTFLGGVDFDAAIVDHLIAEFEKKTGLTFAGDAVAHQRLMDAAERAKCELSEQGESRVRVPFVTVIDGKPHDIDTTLTRNQLEEFAAPLVVRTISVCREVLQARGMEPGAVEEIIVVGGMSRMPLVHAAIEEFFGKAPHKGVHPDEAVALGAALFAHSLGQQEGVVLIDVLPVSIGIGLPGGRLKKIIERNTALPHSKTYEVATTRDNQEELELCVFQGDGERIDGAELLGTVRLAPLPRKPRGQVKIAVEFALSAECLLTITAREMSQGGEVKAAFSTRDTPASVRSRLGVEAAPAAHPSWGPSGGRVPQRSTRATTAERRPQSLWERFLSLFRRTKPEPGGSGPKSPPAVGGA